MITKQSSYSPIGVFDSGLGGLTVLKSLEKILPNVVSYDEEGKPRGIQYTKMTAVLLEAIKEQQTQIDELKSRILN